MFIHLNDFISVDNRQVKAYGIVFGEFRTDHVLLPHQEDAHSIITRSLYRSEYNLARCLIPTHSIQRHAPRCRSDPCGILSGGQVWPVQLGRPVWDREYPIWRWNAPRVRSFRRELAHLLLSSGSPIVVFTSSTSLSRSKGL